MITFRRSLQFVLLGHALSLGCGQTERLGWRLERTLEADAGQPLTTVAVSGDTLLAGALRRDGEASGTVYLFNRRSSLWSQADKWLRPDAQPMDTFGAALAVSGDLAIVGDPQQADRQEFRAAYLFERRGGAWEFSQKLAPQGDAAYRFGAAVAADGERVLVGAPENRAEEPGVAFVYVRGRSAWELEDTLVSSDSHPLDHFGHTVALSGNRALVGALGEGGFAASYLFERIGSTWSEVARLESLEENLSHLVALSGDRALLGRRASSGPAAYLAERVGSSWAVTEQLALEDTPDPRLTGEVALSSGVAVVGLYTKPGFVYEFTRSGWRQTAELRADGEIRSVSDVATDGRSIVALVNRGPASELVSTELHLYQRY